MMGLGLRARRRAAAVAARHGVGLTQTSWEEPRPRLQQRRPRGHRQLKVQ